VFCENSEQAINLNQALETAPWRGLESLACRATRGFEIGELVIHFEASYAPSQNAGGRFDFLRGLPVGHVGVAAFATLTAFNFLGTSCAHK
jgi:hypothetical protein